MEQGDDTGQKAVQKDTNDVTYIGSVAHAHEMRARIDELRRLRCEKAETFAASRSLFLENVAAHYQIWHKDALTAKSMETSRTEKKAAMEHYLSNPRCTQALVIAFFPPTRNREARLLCRRTSSRTAEVQFAILLQWLVDLFGCAELQPFFCCAGGAAEKDNSKYINLLPELY